MRSIVLASARKRKRESFDAAHVERLQLATRLAAAAATGAPLLPLRSGLEAISSLAAAAAAAARSRRRQRQRQRQREKEKEKQRRRIHANVDSRARALTKGVAN